MLRSQKQRRNEYRCLEIVPATGRPCNLLFTRAWNLKRHQRDQHQDRSIVFINYDPTAAQRNMTNPPATETPMPRTPVSKTEIEHRLVPVIQAPAIPPHAPCTPPTRTRVKSAQATSASPTSTQTAPATPTSLPTAASATNDFSRSNSWMPKTPVPYASSVQTQTSAISESTSTPSEMDSSGFLAQPANDITPNRSRSVADVEDPENPTSESNTSIYWTPLQSRSGSPVEQGFETDETRSDRLEMDAYREERMSGLSACEDPSDVGRKRKRSADKGRTVDARLKTAVPTYLVKWSKKTPGQQRGLEWLSASGKAHFDDNHGMLLAQWGVKAGHRGTCVLLPEDWKALDPIDLMTTFQSYTPPSRGSSRAWYSYADHATSLARAAAWYGHWPRTGVELDNFLGCGPFKPMDGSHLCHHEHCIVHLTYESADTNLDRWDCCLEARFLRQEGRQVPEHCGKHSPPCLMQHAALTVRETYYIQFWVLCQAKGIPPTLPLPIPRPRRYLYPTLESQLPCCFPAITVSPDDLIEALPAKKEGRPDLLCAFCPHIKAYASITGFWSHLVNKHKDINDQERLEEIVRGAALWRQYWDEYSDGGKYSNPTMAKLNQIEQQGQAFRWEQVLDWGLR